MKLLESIIVGLCMTILIGLIAYGFALFIRFSEKVNPIYSFVLIFVLVFIACTLVYHSMHK